MPLAALLSLTRRPLLLSPLVPSYGYMHPPLTKTLFRSQSVFSAQGQQWFAEGSSCTEDRQPQISNRRYFHDTRSRHRRDSGSIGPNGSAPGCLSSRRLGLFLNHRRQELGRLCRVLVHFVGNQPGVIGNRVNENVAWYSHGARMH